MRWRAAEFAVIPDRAQCLQMPASTPFGVVKNSGGNLLYGASKSN
jgi:hypothetical protein